MNVSPNREPGAGERVKRAVLTKMRGETDMFYVYELPRDRSERPITLTSFKADDATPARIGASNSEYDEADIDFVDDSLLNTAPHNVIEKQLLRGDMVGLALMSGAIIWSAMGAFG